MSNYNRPFESNGEYLALYLQRNFLGFGDSIWNNLGSVLLPSNRSSEWVAAFQEMTVLQLTRKLISAGEAILSRYGLKIDEAKDDPVLEREIKNMILDTMVIHWEDVNAIFVRLVPAIRSSTKPVTKGVRKEVIGFAKREAFCCYLCGAKLTSLKDRDDTATLDHVWPLAYGGDSVYENLLVACRMCNNLKRDTPAWAMYPIQSLVLGEIDHLSYLPRWIPIAVQTRKARSMAAKESISLREAFIRLNKIDLTGELISDSMIPIDAFSLNFGRA